MNITILSIFYKDKKINYLNLIFSVSLAFTLLIVFGIIPRAVAFLILALYLGFILLKPLNQGINLFLRSIPFFIALPITANFDNFNTWRIIILVIFLKWFFVESNWLKKLRTHFSGSHIFEFIKNNKVEVLGLVFFLISFLSIFLAQDYIAGARRLIYLLNAVLLLIIVRDLVLKDKNNFYNFSRNFAYSGILAVGIGYVQFISAYFVPAWIFHYWWGQVISLGMYGGGWANIVTNLGNTWFSYSGNTLRLRMFSTFPDSHSFPIYVIMTLPSIFVLGFSNVKNFSRFLNKESKKLLEKFHWNSPAANFIAGIALISLALILTGTRGIWIAVFVGFLVIALFKFLKISKHLRKILVFYLIVFFLMFPVYFGIVSFRQFQDTSFTISASVARIRSLIDFGETSNSGRIYIWKETLRSIKERPLLGVGIGNYPVVLDELQTATRAGASAHNIYLQIASTVGVLGLMVFLWMLWEFLVKGIRYLKKNSNGLRAFYVAFSIFSLAWIFAYLMTDAALYDGRALLAFMAILGLNIGVFKHVK